MAIKKGDLVKVIELIGDDKFCGVELNKTYKVISVYDDCVDIDADKGDRCMFYSQLKKVKKKKSKKDLKYWKNNCEEDKTGGPISVLRYITELENTIKQMKDILNK